MKFFLPVVCLIFSSQVFAQSQTCPPNSNFADGTLTNWFAYIGNNQSGNGPTAIKDSFSQFQPPPAGTIGESSIDEYQLPGTKGIQVITTPGTDPFGFFSTLPVINGYRYNSAVLLGSTSITRSAAGGSNGGYVRGIRYLINVPISPATQPYTMTYAYAMVLENGAHNSIDQPLFSATLTHDSVITCASPKYFLPTLNNANGNLPATLDSAAAIANGFTVSRTLSPNPDPNPPGIGHLQDVWTKGWTEVTFDLSPYRGEQVTLTFEADNCVPGGHFAYAYVALRNTCDGLLISGDTVGCIGTLMTYSIPSLAGGSYDWTVPVDWSIVSGSASNILQVTAGGASAGKIIAHEVNGCADLRDTLPVTTVPATIAGAVSGNATVCTGTNSSPLLFSGYLGNVLEWISSTSNGASWSPVVNTLPQYTAQGLDNTTIYEAVVQNGYSCAIDTSTGATITVDSLSVGGSLLPANQEVCRDQYQGAVLNLSGYTGTIQNWQSSLDTLNWFDFTPVDTATVFNIVDITSSTQYRVIVKSGVCPPDTSSLAYADLVPPIFPQVAAEPADTTICYGATASLNASITVGTNYTWTDTQTLTGEGNGDIAGTPYSINAAATPLQTTDYVLKVQNSGCPNALLDTFDVHVVPPIVVNAGNDTSVVINQPLQLLAVSNNPGDSFTWTPATDLNNPDIPNPVAIYGPETDSVRYMVKASSPTGCFGLADILVTVFKTAPDIFVPNAFTPGGPSNSVFRPIPVGVASLQFFRVYNRWGQLVFATSTIGQGWDGNLNGRPQDAGGYVWLVRGTSYTGKVIFKKGVMVLVR